MQKQKTNKQKNFWTLTGDFFLVRAGHGWWWVPLIVTCVGALLGSLLYELLIGVHHPDSKPMDPEGPTAMVQKTVELEGVYPEMGKDRIFSITSADIN